MFAPKPLADNCSLFAAGVAAGSRRVCPRFFAADQRFIDGRNYSDTGMVRRRRVSLFDIAPVSSPTTPVAFERRRKSSLETTKFAGPLTAVERSSAPCPGGAGCEASATLRLWCALASEPADLVPSSYVTPLVAPAETAKRLPSLQPPSSVAPCREEVPQPMGTESLSAATNATWTGNVVNPEASLRIYESTGAALDYHRTTSLDALVPSQPTSHSCTSLSLRFVNEGNVTNRKVASTNHADSNPLDSPVRTGVSGGEVSCETPPKIGCLPQGDEISDGPGPPAKSSGFWEPLDRHFTTLQQPLPVSTTTQLGLCSSAARTVAESSHGTVQLSTCGGVLASRTDSSHSGDSTTASAESIGHPLLLLRGQSMSSAPLSASQELLAVDRYRGTYNVSSLTTTGPVPPQRRRSDSSLFSPPFWSDIHARCGVAPVASIARQWPPRSPGDRFGTPLVAALVAIDLHRPGSAIRPQFLQLPPNPFLTDVSSRNLSSDTSGHFELATSSLADFSPLSNFDASEESPGGSLDSVGAAAPPLNYVRQRRTAVSSESVTARGLQSWTAPFFPKTSEEEARILNVLQDRLVAIFGPLPNQNLIVNAMQKKHVVEGTVLIRQGDEGDFFYIVDSGHFEIFVQRGDAEPKKVLDVGSGGSFGELALMYLAPRAATCTAVEDSVVWALDRISFRMLLVTAENTKRKEYESFLENIEIFKCLTKFEIARLSDILVVREFCAGDCVIKQGTVGEHFFIVESGILVCKMASEASNTEIEVHQYTRGGYFGELALIMTSGIRKASVYAVGNSRLLAIDKPTFDRVLGPVVELLQKNAGDYPTYAEILKRHEVEEK